MKKSYKLKKINSLKGGNRIPLKCNKDLFPELPSILNTDRSKISRIIAVGDIHGDLNLAIKYLEIPKLIVRVYEEDDMTVSLWFKDESIKRIYKWIGEKTIVVQVGDQVDRCRPFKQDCDKPDTTINDEASDLTIMFFYSDLHIVASKVNCALFSLLGNHELMNVFGNMQYVSYKGLLEFPTTSKNLAAERINTFSLNSTKKIYKNQASMVEFLGCSRLATIIVDGYLFVHAGIMEQLTKFILKTNKDIVPTINNSIKSWLLSSYDDKDKEFIQTLLTGNTLSPFWVRTLGSIQRNLDIETSECKKLVEPILKILSIKGIVIGHTPQLKTNITSTCSNTVWRVDIASSQAFDEVIFSDVKDSDKQEIQKGRIPQVLEITLGDDKTPDSFKILLDN